MGVVQRKLTAAFKAFFDSEKSSGVFLIACTAISLAVANSSIGPNYLDAWHTKAGGLSIEHWINDGSMAIFFLLIGLELKRALYTGELSEFRSALLPVAAAAGGVAAPALIHLALNMGTPERAGAGIPMATDIAFALGALAILGNRIPASLKIFVVAFAVIDDLFAIVVIAVFYTAELSLPYLAAALVVLAATAAGGRLLRITSVFPYLVAGAFVWFLMLRSGVHPTIAGVLLAFAIPASAAEDDDSPSGRLESFLHKPVAFLILPLFALCNTGVIIGGDRLGDLAAANSVGIVAGLVIGKPLGIMLASEVAVRLGICRLPADLERSHIFGAGLLGGIGFTMSIFITNLAFSDPQTVNASKAAILLASLTAGIAGSVWLRFATKKNRPDKEFESFESYPAA